MDLVVDQMVELQEILVAHGHRPRERLASAPVIERHLAALVEPGQFERVVDVRFFGAVEDRSRDRHPAADILRRLNHLVVGHVRGRLREDIVAIDDLHRVLDRGHVALAAIGVERVRDDLA